MFKREESEHLENDFNQYGANSNLNVKDTQENKEESNTPFGSIIQILIILVLFIITAYLIMFGYKYMIKEDNIRSNQTQNISTPTTQQAPQIKTGNLKAEDISMIVQAVMAQMNSASSKTKDSQTDDKDFISSLVEAEVDRLDNVQNDTNLEMTKEEQSKEAGDNLSEKDMQRFNKVVVTKKENTLELDALSRMSMLINDEIEKDFKEDFKKQKKTKYTQSIAKEIKTREKEMKFITVKSGDTLSKIALKAYGTVSAYKKIIKANPELIKNKRLIYPGQKLRIPE
jgi:LysM repeat protein